MIHDIFYKKELGTYQENLKKFQTELTEFMDILKTSPKIGSNLSVRISLPQFCLFTRLIVSKS